MVKKIKVPLEILALQEDGHHIFLNGTIGNHSVRLLIDTGASKTVIDKNFISEKIPELRLEQTDQLTTGVGTNTIQSEFTRMKSLTLGSIRVSPYIVAVLDLKHVNETYGVIKLPSIQGVIGCDLLVQYNAIINFKKKQLRLKYKDKK
ncbi:MAG: clan AA aspartic protease [Chitinophagales bacterium]|nr:clan AA aspartic protease [Chitinophagales bacterium]